jgi:two-component sensor histidine kinase
MKLLQRKKADNIVLTSLSKWQIKLMLIGSAFIIVMSAVYYTRLIVDELIDREKKTVTFYADIYKRLSDPNVSNNQDLFFLIEKIAPTIPFPIILTDDNDNPVEPFKDNSMNVQIDTTLSTSEQREYMRDYISEMGQTYPPIIIQDSDGKILSKIYYTHSALINKLQLFPFVSIAVVGVFVFVGYIAFSNIRRSEESKVWVGMAKEAAHQLGTPLSSLLAWLEILKDSKDNPASVEEIAGEMDNDVSRLNIIATRFSKIGSKPEMKIEDIGRSIESVCNYFEKRLPHLGKRIEIERDLKANLKADVNPELFAWVIENLLKNAAEAIENKKGKVVVSLFKKPKNKIIIHIRDNGKGMTNKQRRQVFQAGYTTKKRGWGLGLSLCKRIIEDYHKGKIYVKDSVPGKGTTSSIELNQAVSIEKEAVNS